MAPLGTPSAPLVICLACEADDQPRRSAEIAALAADLEGCAEVELVSGRTIAIRADIPPSHAARFAAALTLAGAQAMGPIEDNSASAFVVILTIEHTAQERNSR